jgi:hypothetical protein
MEERMPWGKFDIKNLEKLQECGLKLHFYKTKTSAMDPAWTENYALSEISNDGTSTYFVVVSDDENYDFPLKEMPSCKLFITHSPLLSALLCGPTPYPSNRPVFRLP